MSEVTIRPITEADTDKIVAWRNNPSVQEHFIYRAPFTRESHLNWFHTRVETGEVAQFMIVADGEEVGSVYLRDIDQKNKKAEYGIFIGEDANRGMGVGTEAARLIIDYAFCELKLNRVYLRVFAANTRAIKSYEKAGFRFEGRFRDDVIIDGEAYDIVFMGILREDWLKGE